MKSELDVLVVGGYGMADKADGGNSVRDRIRLTYKDQAVSLGFIKHFVESNGNLNKAEKRYISDPLLRQFPRQLNTIYLYDYLRRQGFETAAVSYYAFEQDKFEAFMNLKPRILALSTTFISDPAEASEIAQRAKEISPETVVIAGGMKVLKSYKQLLLSQQGDFDGLDQEELAVNSFFYNPSADKEIDAFVIEESGELTLIQIIQNAKTGQDYRYLPNLAYYEEDQVVFTRRQKEPCNLEEHLIEWEKVPFDLIGNEIPVRAGIGCPFRCAFCDFADLHDKIELRSINNVIDELRRIQTVFPGKPIFFTDENLFISKNRTRKLCQAIIDSGLKFPWRAFFRVDSVNDEIAALAAESGCKMALLGVESGDPQVLKNMDKRITPEQTVRTVTLLNQNRISTVSTMIVGFPGETTESVNNTIDMLNSYPQDHRALHLYYPFVFTLFPLCRASLPQMRQEFDIRGLYSDWSHKTMNVHQAQEQLERMVKEVRVPLLQYPEQSITGIDPTTTVRLMREREQIVRDGINVLNNENASAIYARFKRILAPDSACVNQHKYQSV